MDGKDRPVPVGAEQAAGGQLQHVVRFAQCGPGITRILEIDDHVDALFLDAESRDLGEAGGLDPADTAVREVR